MLFSNYLIFFEPHNHQSVNIEYQEGYEKS